MFEKTLTDIVKGIRASKRDTALYISQCIAEIKTEINSSDMFVKANALQKLTFLQMMGYTMNWASFATIEVMSSPRFAHKRIGYLAAAQGFTQHTEVILLTTNLLQKELRGGGGNSGSNPIQGVYEAGLAINCISNIITPDLARDLLPEVVQLTSHSNPYLRKKAILCLFKLFVQYPQGLRLTFNKTLQPSLQDSNPAVVSCAVNVITELSDKNPKNYLHLAPAFFDLLTTSSNNWMLIKVVKLLGSLVPEEPRLARKLLEPLAQIVKTTQAKSLLYEAVHTITLCLPYCRRKSDGSMPAIVPEIVQLSAQTLKSLIEEQDQNLKYLGLVGFASLMTSHPKVLSGSSDGTRPLILACLSDQDVTIRTRALDLLGGLATRKNLVELVSQLLQHVPLARGAYKHDLVQQIVEMCRAEKYALLQDFAWYWDRVLLFLGHARGVETHAALLRAELTNVALRVLPVRQYAVQRCMEILLTSPQLTVGKGSENQQQEQQDPSSLLMDNGRGKDIMPELLPALAWIVGEYSDLIPSALETISGSVMEQYQQSNKGYHHALIQVLSSPCNVSRVVTSTQKVFVQAAMKIFAAASATAKKVELEACLYTLQLNLPIFMQSVDVEVVERAFTGLELLRSLHLTSGGGDAPGMVALDDDEDSDDDDVKPATSGDLLGLDGGEAATPEPVLSKSTTTSSSTSLGSKIKGASATLNYLLKPSPMKPSGAKAQRKKRSAPPMGATAPIDLEAPLDTSVFQALIDEEKQYLETNKLSLESVSFTQQRPMASSSQQPVTSSMPGVAGGGMVLDSVSSSSPMVGISSSTPFQAGGQPQRQSDPFYLASGSQTTPTAATDEYNDASSPHNGLGIIQLADSDGEEPQSEKKAKKKKKKKDKKNAAAAPVDDVMLAFGGSAITESTPSQPTATATATTIYDSDDDDDDEPLAVNRNKKKSTSKEFAGLSKVDITQPLREDEVMPQQQRYEAPTQSAGGMLGSSGVGFSDIPQNQPPVVPEPMPEPKKSKKELKKERKAAKKKKKEQKAQAAAGTATTGTGDLLDLGVFGDAGPSAAPAAPAPQPAGGNAISSAFDDLLGLDAPAPAPVLAPASSAPSSNAASDFAEIGAAMTPVAAPQVAASSAGSKPSRPWMKGSIKSNSAAGGGVDWSRVNLLARVYHTNKGGGAAAAMLKVRVDNQQDAVSLTNLMLDLNDGGVGSVSVGSAGPGASVETSKIGPFVYPSADVSHEIRGTLRLQDGTSSVPVKLLLPATMHLTPQEGMQLEQVAQELASVPFASASAKVDMPAGSGIEDVKQAMSGFLRAGIVAEDGSNPKASTLAAMSSSGNKIRVLVKLKDSGTVKVDFRCTNPNLANSLASDIKKIVF